jgi:peptidylprolyl isomerase
VRLPRLRTAAIVLLSVAMLAACGTSSKSGSEATSPDLDNLNGVSVLGGAGAKPGLVFTSPFTVSATTTRVLTAGTGATISKGQKVTIDLLIVNGRDGKEMDTTFGKQPTSLVADPKKVFPGLVKGIVGQKVGSRVLVAIPPADAFGVQGNKDAGVEKDDTLIALLDLESARSVLAQAKGTPVPPVPGLPSVTIAATGKPTIAIPVAVPPKQLVKQLLLKGDGPVVKAGQKITVHYTGVVWAGGKEFDSSFKTGRPAEFAIGVGQVVKGWDQGLVGQTVGSRLILVIPPALGYGAAGQPQAGIKGTDTLVFVIDILDAG